MEIVVKKRLVQQENCTTNPNNYREENRMEKIARNFKVVEGTKGSKRGEFYLQFGAFRVKKLADTKQNRIKAEQRGSMYYLEDTRKLCGNRRVSSVYLVDGLNRFIFDTDTPKNMGEYPKGYFMGMVLKPGVLEVIEITKSQYKEYKRVVA